jgi:exodeoxyribonuclease (lambda-induced)
MILWNNAEQGTDAWKAARRGRITGSRFKDARARLKNGSPAGECLGYAYDVARERLGGIAPAKFTTSAMREGTTNEPLARMKYEARTGEIVDEVGFAYTEDGKFGLSPDGLIGDDGVWECKTMVSSKTLFEAMVDGDISEYRDQCLGYLWLLHRQWVDLTLYCPDLDLLHVVRITRDEDEIQKLVDDLMAFDRLVESLRARLAALMPEQDAALDGLTLWEAAEPAAVPAPEAAPAAAPATPAPKAVRPDELADALPF